MSAFVLITGVIFRAPEQRVSKEGKPFATAVLHTKGLEERLQSQALQRHILSSGAIAILRLADGASSAKKQARRLQVHIFAMHHNYAAAQRN